MAFGMKNSIIASLAFSLILTCCEASPLSTSTLAGVAGGAVLYVAGPVILPVVGFTAGGIAAGSWAASMMSIAATANGGGVAAGSVVALLQAAGAGSTTAALTLAGMAGSSIIAAWSKLF
ncbi:interferon alpha-inducible protein 27-like protein 1 [Diadema antillarum]|uniref:interferon alpha-inducible protein 27-like protein 1 n=1 Tax=Diadema antillarum TaxID=105358 RepID=UPI003A8ADB3C